MYFVVNILSVLFISAALLLPANAAGGSFSFGASMIDAADGGNEYVVANLLKNGKSPNVRGKFGVTPLMRATIRGHELTVRMLLDAGANPNIKDVGGATALHLAARMGDSNIVRMLLSHGANVNAEDVQSYTPLMRAINKRDVSSVKSMVQKGANLDLLNKYNTSARQMIHDSKNKALIKASGVSSTQATSNLEVKEVLKKTEEVVIKENVLGKLASDKPKKKEKHSNLSYKERVVTGDLVRDLNAYIKDPNQSMVKEEFIDDDELEDEIISEVTGEGHEMKIAEAIKLPNAMDMDDPDNKIIVNDTVRNLRNEVESSDGGSYMAAPAREYWMEISGFDDELDALNFWQKASRDSNFKKLKAKLLDKEGPKMTKVLRFGKFKDSRDVFHKCKLARKLNSKVICYVLSDAY